MNIPSMVKYVVKDFLSFSLNYENLKFLGQNTAKTRGLKPKKRSSPDTRLRVEAPGLVKTSGLNHRPPACQGTCNGTLCLKQFFSLLSARKATLFGPLISIDSEYFETVNGQVCGRQEFQHNNTNYRLYHLREGRLLFIQLLGKHGYKRVYDLLRSYRNCCLCLGILTLHKKSHSFRKGIMALIYLLLRSREL